METCALEPVLSRTEAFEDRYRARVQVDLHGVSVVDVLAGEESAVGRVYRRLSSSGRFWPKDLPECLRLVSSIAALYQILVKEPGWCDQARSSAGDPSANIRPQDDRPLDLM